MDIKVKEITIDTPNGPMTLTVEQARKLMAELITLFGEMRDIPPIIVNPHPFSRPPLWPSYPQITWDAQYKAMGAVPVDSEIKTGMHDYS